MTTQDCMIIRGADLDDGTKEFRPSSSWPDHHWTTRLMDAYKHQANFHIKHQDEEFVVTITRDAKDENEVLFQHIMRFAKLHNLDFTVCKRECMKCEGHPDCLSQVDVNEINREKTIA